MHAQAHTYARTSYTIFKNQNDILQLKKNNDLPEPIKM